jgi:hypothetical protein
MGWPRFEAKVVGSRDEGRQEIGALCYRGSGGGVWRQEGPKEARGLNAPDLHRVKNTH